MRGIKFKLSSSKNAQIWVETVIYTLIALSLMGLLLAFAKPKIDSLKDRMLIEQTIESMNKISEQINEVQIAPGNRRILAVKINKGSFVVDPPSNSLAWSLESNYKFSEIDQPARLGSLFVLTTGEKPYAVSVYSNYSVDLTLNGEEKPFSFESSPTPYTVTILNTGINIDVIVK